MAQVIQQDAFNTFIHQTDKPVLVDFWATWCGPCRMLAPVVEEISTLYADKIHVGKVDVDESPEAARQFGIMTIPTLILFKNGEIVDKQVGYMTKDALAAMVEKAL